jgi:hypothetical protein
LAIFFLNIATNFQLKSEFSCLFGVLKLFSLLYFT